MDSPLATGKAKPNMFLWLFRAFRNLLTAVFALAGLLALSEVGLRVHRLTENAANNSPKTAQTPAWLVPSDLTGYQLPRWQRFDVDSELGAGHWTTNSWGFRGPDPICPKPTEYYRIVCLGDEALLAPTLNDQFTLITQLQQRLQMQATRPIEVINAALPQSCPLTMAIQMRSQIMALQPDLILVQISSANMARDDLLRRWAVKDTHGRTVGCVNPAGRPQPGIAKLTECRQEFALLDWGLTQLGQVSPATTISPRLEIENAALDANRIRNALLPFADIANSCQALGTPCVVWCCPAVAHSEVVSQHRHLLDAMTPELRSKHIPTVDALQAISPVMLDDQYGWTAEGHLQLAIFLASQLTQNLAGPWTEISLPTGIQPVGHHPEDSNSIPTIQRAIR